MACESEEIMLNAPRSCKMSSASVRLATDARFGERDVLRNRWVQMVTDHQHVQMLVDGIYRIRTRGFVDEGSTFGSPQAPDDVRTCRCAARRFGVIGVDRAALEGREGVLDEARFVQRIRMDRDLHVQALGHG